MPLRSDPNTPIRCAVLLGEVAKKNRVLEVTCNRCERHGWLRIARLIAEYGPQMPLPDLLRILSADCPKRMAGRWPDICGAHFSGLARVRL